MNGKMAKKLRRIAKHLKLDPRRRYGIVNAQGTRALGPVERRAYLEAKKLYNDKSAAEMAESLQPMQTVIVPPDPVPAFKHKLIDSISQQPEGPV